MDKEILRKYLNNNCSDEEFEEFVAWLKKESCDKEGRSRNWVFEHWKLFEPELKKKDEKKYNALLDKIHHGINLKQTEEGNRRIVNLPAVAKWLSRAAAILFIPLLGVVFYLLSYDSPYLKHSSGLAADSLEVIAPIGSRTVVQLSDGTEVNLNYGSRIKYPRDFIGKTREILLSGEGYFKVAHNPGKPFIVKTGNLNIRAVGTEFNVHAYPDDDAVATTLVEGKVVLESILPGQKIGKDNTMIPGQHVTYNIHSGKVTSDFGRIDKYISWKDGKLVFDNDPISEIAEKLGRMFNVDIEIADNAKDFSYTVTFFNDPLYLILDLMTETTPIKYIILPRHKQSDGTYSKQKIKIEKRD